MSDWRSIDESPASEPVVLKGIPITGPKVYAKLQARRGGWFTLAAIAAGIWRTTAWSASLLGHFILMIVLVGILLSKPNEGDTLLEVSLHRGKAGDHGKALTPLKAETPAEPQPTRAPETKAERKTETTKEPVEEPLPDDPVEPQKKSEETAKKEEDKTEKSTNSVGGGGGKVSPPKDPGKDAGKLIERDPTSATRATRAGDLAKLRRGGDREIVVVGGTYDRVELVLQALDVPHTRIEYGQLGRYDLSKCLVLLVNCHSILATSNSAMPSADKWKPTIDTLRRRVKDAEERLDRARRADDKRQVRLVELELNSLRQSLRYYERLQEDMAGAASVPDNIRRFVERGGYLFTSDWGLTLLERLYPELLGNGGNHGPNIVRIQPGKHAESPLLEWVFTRPAKSGSTTSARDLRWDIDSGSYLIRIRSDRVVPIIESPQLGLHRSVAVVFQPAEKSGRVLHVLSHFAKQEDSHGEYALQNLLLNFMLERFAKP